MTVAVLGKKSKAYSVRRHPELVRYGVHPELVRYGVTLNLFQGLCGTEVGYKRWRC